MKSFFSRIWRWLSRALSNTVRRWLGETPDDSQQSSTSHLTSVQEDLRHLLSEDVFTRERWIKFLKNYENGSGAEGGSSQGS